MSKKSVWHRIIHPLTGYFRKKRGVFIQGLYPDIGSMKICDIGGSVHFWEKLSLDIDFDNIKIYNISDAETSSLDQRTASKLRVVLYDGKTIPEVDNAFDLVVCNSVIEHVPVDQRLHLIEEMQRVGKRLFLQTPAYEFFLEPHFVMPLIHWLPGKLGFLLIKISPWRILSQPDRNTINNYFWGTKLLGFGEVKSLMPGCKIYKETIFGITKSYMVDCSNNK